MSDVGTQLRGEAYRSDKDIFKQAFFAFGDVCKPATEKSAMYCLSQSLKYLGRTHRHIVEQRCRLFGKKGPQGLSSKAIVMSVDN